MFPAYGGKCLSSKGVHNLVEKRGKDFDDDEEFETRWGSSWESSQKLLHCGFRRTGKAMGQVHQL
jgi:hypothetical protein